MIKLKNQLIKKFNSKTGLYKSSWIVKEYKKRGGKYKGKKTSKTGLIRWYKEDWVDLNRYKNGKYEKCGRKSTKKGKYPVCRPSKRITSKTPRTFKEISKKSLKKAKLLKNKLKSHGNVQFGAGNNDFIQTPSLFLPIVFISILSFFIV